MAVHIAELRAFLNSTAVGQPLDWSDLPPADLADGSVCELDRCFGVDARAANMSAHHHAGSETCGAAGGAPNCTALAPSEWLANVARCRLPVAARRCRSAGSAGMAWIGGFGKAG